MEVFFIFKIIIVDKNERNINKNVYKFIKKKCKCKNKLFKLIINNVEVFHLVVHTSTLNMYNEITFKIYLKIFFNRSFIDASVLCVACICPQSRS